MTAGCGCTAAVLVPPETRGRADPQSLGGEAVTGAGPGAAAGTGTVSPLRSTGDTVVWLDVLVLFASDGGRDEFLAAVRSWLGDIVIAFREMG